MKVMVFLVGLILLFAGLVMIPIDIDGKDYFQGYDGTHYFTNEEYSTFKRAVIEHSTLEGRIQIAGSFSEVDAISNLNQIDVYDSHEPVVVEYFNLLVDEEFPYGEAYYFYYDSGAATWLKPLLIIIGAICAIIGLCLLKDDKERK